MQPSVTFERVLLAGSTFPDALHSRLKQCAAKVAHVSSVEEATRMCREGEAYDAIFADAQISLPTVLELLRAAASAGNVVVGLVDRADIQRRTRLEQTGVFDVLPLPCSEDAMERILSCLRKYLLLLSEAQHHRVNLARPEELIGRSEVMRNIISSLKTRAEAPGIAFISGEHGTGKDVFARTLHRVREGGQRTYFAVECSGLPESLLEAQIFGRSSGTSISARPQRIPYLPLAGGGTLLLNNIDAMPAKLQQRLVQYLQRDEGEGVEPARIICTSRRRLAECAQSGSIIPELQHQMRELHLPPLRERNGDTLLLADYFLQVMARALGRDVAFDASAREAILAHSWPGNVAEVKCSVQRALYACPGPKLSDAALALSDSPAPSAPSAPPAAAEASPGLPAGAPPPSLASPDAVSFRVGQTLAAVEHEMIVRTVEKTKGNRTEAAAILGISVRTLYTKLLEQQQVSEPAKAEKSRA